MIRDQFSLLTTDEIIVDNFAGGGGASTGLELGLGRHVDIAINHDPEAIALHAANHPQTEHYIEDVFAIDPRTATRGRPVGLGWLSPDCKHHSKAKGGKPREKKIRGLAWVGVKWAGTTKMRGLMLENVEEFQDWGPLIAKRCKDTGRVVKLDGTVAAPGERVPVHEQHLVPCPRRKGRHFRQFIASLRRMGYDAEWRELRACDYGAPTTRKRLFLIARNDRRPIIWAAPTHGDPTSELVKRRKLKPYRTAAECIDFSIPCTSIFGRTRPLADATLRRIARGIVRYVLEAEKPFIAPAGTTIVAPFITEHANASHQRNFSANEPLRTQCAEVKGGHFALVAATLIKHYGGNYTGPGVDLNGPIHAITATDHHALVTSHLVKLRKGCDGQSVDTPIGTATSREHFGEVRAFLVKYYGNELGGVSLQEPMHTITATDRMGLITVRIDGETYAIADIGMRMLEPHELYAAQGFPPGYRTAIDYRGKRLSKSAQVRMCGNSVSPVIPAALARANFPELCAWNTDEVKTRRSVA